ncbi:MAG TPA: adenylosuccinate lyase [Acidobacteriota bacterium]|nr:adenylosuccinate lyase [Acidobacteriota bacterium]
MIDRYTPSDFKELWSEENMFRTWLRVEIEVCRVLTEMGWIPRESMENIERKADFSLPRIQEIEKITHHDLIAFTTSVAEYVGSDARFIHWGLTSTDVIDTARALQVREASESILAAIDGLMEAIKRRALEHRGTLMMGRTHGVHAEVTTFGLKLAVWYDEMRRNRERMRRAAEVMRGGKISGAVGTFAHLDPEVEARVCERLGLKAAAVSTQTLQRDRHAEYMGTLAVIGASLEKFATEIRHLQRTEVREVEEPFAAGQKGSSAMPHKRNPVKCEQVCGLSRLLRGYSMTALEDVALWHERDISHSSAERVILPDATSVLCYMLRAMNRIVGGLLVYPERMLKNMELTRGLAYSGKLLLDLTRKGVSREDAYAWVQRSSMRVWNEDVDFLVALQEDPDVTRVLSVEEVRSALNPEHELRNVGAIFDRVFHGTA